MDDSLLEERVVAVPGGGFLNPLVLSVLVVFSTALNVVLGASLMTMMMMTRRREQQQPLKKEEEPEPPPPKEEEEVASAPSRVTRRFDCEIAARQRRLCVPLSRWNNAVEMEGPAAFFVSAQFGADEWGVLHSTAELQCSAAFANLKRALEDGGRSFDDVAKLTVYMAHGRCGLAQYRAVEAKIFHKHNLPAVTIVFVKAFATENIFLQIEAIAS